MSLTINEKISAALAFIPVISTVSSAIKIFYRRGMKGDITQVESTAAKVSQASKTSLNTSPLIQEYNKKLLRASIWEMIPLVNIFAAIYSTINLRKLSQLREVNTNPQAKEDYLAEKYGINFNDSKNKEKLLEALVLIDNIRYQR